MQGLKLSVAMELGDVVKLVVATELAEATKLAVAMSN